MPLSPMFDLANAMTLPERVQRAPKLRDILECASNVKTGVEKLDTLRLNVIGTAVGMLNRSIQNESGTAFYAFNQCILLILDLGESNEQHMAGILAQKRDQ